MIDHTMTLGRTAGLLAACSWLLGSVVTLGAQQPMLTITEPSSAPTVRVGDVLRVVVDVQPPGTGMQVAIMGSPGFPSSTPTTGSYVFDILIPTTTPLGAHTIGAYGLRNGREAFQSAKLAVIVDAAVEPDTIEVIPSEITLRYRGQQQPLTVTGISATGERFTLTHSPRLTITSTDPQIASVVDRSTVLAQGFGTTTLDVSVGNASVSLPVVIVTPAVVGDFDGDNDIDTEDIDYLNMWRNTPPTAATDDRDLNGDRKLDALDARVLTLRCTRPRCAIQ